jgi:hypothetical protein
MCAIFMAALAALCRFRLFLTVLGLIWVSCAVAHAQASAAGSTSVSLPIGDWLADAAAFIGAIAAAVVAWLLRKLPASVQQVLTTMQAEQLLGKAIDYALNAVAGAEKGKTLDVKVGSAVVASAVQYVVDHGPTWLIAWLGGAAAIEQKIIARLDLDANSAVVTASAIVPTSVLPASASPTTSKIVTVSPPSGGTSGGGAAAPAGV